MQDHTEDQITYAKTGKLRSLLDEPMQEGTTHRVVGLFPQKNEVVTFRGLQWEVRFSNSKTGELRLKLQKLDAKS